jgi:cytoskeletal protein CcmA (bactofilin family)
MFDRKGFDGRAHHGVPATAAITAEDAAPPELATPAGLAIPSSPANDPISPPNRLVVGRNLIFEGAISTCDHLVVGGSVVGDLDHCQTIDIVSDGSFHGTATADDADIAGAFEGELTVTGQLHIRATGQVRGRVTYGTLAIEPGGHLRGIVESMAEAMRSHPRPVVVPLHAAKDHDHDGQG